MKSRIIKKRQIAAGAAAIALCTAVFLNWYYTKQGTNLPSNPEKTSEINLGDAQYVNGTNVTNESDYFTASEINRSKAHDTAKEYLESIVSDENVDSEEKEEAKKKLIEISNEIKTETDLQNLITAKLNCKCLVTLNDSKLEVVLPKGVLSDDKLITIKDVVTSNSNVPSDNITVIELK
ncbi:MAG: SpoIIIAH-like family protein [Oscillospiraceae bacterium]|nr:SpoIIIAH-like family protein [Oscillospiraceae bacterium]